MSTISSAPTSSAISRKRAKSSWRGYADQPASSSFGRRSRAMPRDLVHVDQAALAVDLVGGDVVQATGDVDLHAVREVAAVGQREAHDRVARLQQRVVDGRVGLRAGVRLDVGVLGAEQRLGAVDRELLGDVHPLAAAVVAAAGVALGVLVGEDRALAFEHRARHEVLRGDHLERALLALELAAQGLGDLGIDLGEGAVEVVGAQLGHGALLGQAVRTVRAQARGGFADRFPVVDSTSGASRGSCHEASTGAGFPLAGSRPEAHGRRE